MDKAIYLMLEGRGSDSLCRQSDLDYLLHSMPTRRWGNKPISEKIKKIFDTGEDE